MNGFELLEPKIFKDFLSLASQVPDQLFGNGFQASEMESGSWPSADDFARSCDHGLKAALVSNVVRLSQHGSE